MEAVLHDGTLGCSSAGLFLRLRGPISERSWNIRPVIANRSSTISRA